jgi:hypothetical protein
MIARPHGTGRVEGELTAPNTPGIWKLLNVQELKLKLKVMFACDGLNSHNVNN